MVICLLAIFTTDCNDARCRLLTTTVNLEMPHFSCCSGMSNKKQTELLLLSSSSGLQNKRMANETKKNLCTSGKMYTDTDISEIG